MEYRNLGQSGLQISALSLGSWMTFGLQIDNKTAATLMDMAYEQGVNFFDNAETYANGESERVMGAILKQRSWPRSAWMVSSKVYFGYEDHLPNQWGLSRKHVIEGCNAALSRLQVDYLDLFFCHRPDKRTPIAETVQAIQTLLQQGKILYWGTSHWSAAEIMEAHLVCQQNGWIGPVVEQPQYNLFERQKLENEYLHLFKYHGMGTTVWSPLASGLLSGKYNQGMVNNTRLGLKGMEWLKDMVLADEKIEKVKALATLAQSLDLPLPVLAIAWCLKNPNVSTVILGASKPEQLQQNLTALAAVDKITDEVHEAIETIMNNKPVLPNY